MELLSHFVDNQAAEGRASQEVGASGLDGLHLLDVVGSDIVDVALRGLKAIESDSLEAIAGLVRVETDNQVAVGEDITADGSCEEDGGLGAFWLKSDQRRPVGNPVVLAEDIGL